MNEKTALGLLCGFTILSALAAAGGFATALFLIVFYPADFSKTDEIIYFVLQWAIPLVFTAAIIAAWWLFKKKWFRSAWLLSAMPFLVVLGYLVMVTVYAYREMWQ